MKYKLYSHRYAGAILETDDEFTYLWEEIKEILVNITEENIISYFEMEDGYGNRVFKNKSISRTINDLLKKEDRKSTRLNSSHVSISYAVFCLKKKNTQTINITT